MTETSREYAAALFSLALEDGSTGDMLEPLRSFAELLRENPDYYELLSSPALSRSERVALLLKVLPENIPEYAQSFLSLLCENGNIRIIDRCIDEYEKLYRASENISAAQVTSALPLTDNEKELLREKLERKCGHPLIFNYSVDESLIGGVVVSMDDNIIDGSLKHRLHEIKEVMSK